MYSNRKVQKSSRPPKNSIIKLSKLDATAAICILILILQITEIHAQNQQADQIPHSDSIQLAANEETSGTHSHLWTLLSLSLLIMNLFSVQFSKHIFKKKLNEDIQKLIRITSPGTTDSRASKLTGRESDALLRSQLRPFLDEWRNAIEKNIRFTSIVQQVPEAMVMTDLAGSITWSNIAYQNLCLKLDKESEHQFFDYERWQNRPQYHNQIDIEACYQTNHFSVPDGQINIKWTRNVLINVAGTKIVGYLFMGIDVTWERQNEALLKKKQADLTASNTRLKTAALIKSNFLSCVNHELRTPINGIVGTLQLLTSTKLNKEQNLYASLAKHSANTLSTLINDILEFSSLDCHTIKLENHPFNLPQTLSDCCQTLSLSAQSKGIDLILDVNGIDQVKLIGDANRLKQVVNILCSNAIKYTKTGHVIIRATLTPPFDHRRVLTLNVIDTGIGMDSATVLNMFDEFKQEDSSTTRKHSGIGLGLSFAKQLCKLMQGDIIATSTPGQGSVFTATLQLDSKLEYQSALPLPILSGKNAIVLSKSSPTRDVVINTVGILGGNCYPAEGISALSQVTSKQQGVFIDMIFLDTSIEEASPDLLAGIFSNKNFTQSPFIITLGELFNSPNMSAIMRTNIDAHCVKPISPTSLFSALEPILVDQNSTLNHPPSPVSNLKVLVVDDNELNLMIAQGILEELGYDSEPACNGEEAITKMKVSSTVQHPYDLIFMDCQMPVMDGFEATRRIRAGEAGETGKDVPIVALTANVTPEDKARCEASGMTDFLPKPVDAEAIDLVISKQCIRERQAS